jgi:hypothetical protein
MLIAIPALYACAGTQKDTAAKDEAGSPIGAELQSATLESVQKAKPLETSFTHAYPVASQGMQC